ncbi:DUF3105 domain-containing protein [Gordonia sp. ABSL1-1]|uniref:DUF3105 domain-containing protein n=1 Tax=Gordonia sp. ABSL1-1 TaxID=3053923 RepID=UPI0025735FC6|nr:DUF3105 domain-containing protein [Gordonia sp. ABSL1-1]MDL9937046.1 DUF3105 domain-containing protein [Gordonia sp. ABSL1-1]
MARKPGAQVPKTNKRGKAPTGVKGGIDWLVVGSVAVVIALIAGLAVYLVPKFTEKRDADQAAAAQAERAEQVKPNVVEAFVPTVTNPDPATKIPGVTKIYYPAGQHVSPTQRVAYDQSPPFGGPHDAIWASCTGIVYPKPLRSENAVHALEHGAVWVTYNPDTISPDDLEFLKLMVGGEQYLFLSPYPGLSSPISLQSWGHQLKVDKAEDPRVDQFITALRRNTMTKIYAEDPNASAYPETQATCGPIPGFDPSDPPAADLGPAGPGAVPMSGVGTDSPSSPMPTN